MRKLLAATLLLAAGSAAAGEPARVQGKVTRDGQTHALTHAVAWQSARPDALVLVIADTDVALMDVRHTPRLKQLAEEGKLHGLRFEFDPAYLDARWISGNFMNADWNTFRAQPPARWQALSVANGRMVGRLDAGGVTFDVDVPIAGATGAKILFGEDAQRSPQADALIAYENAVRKGSWKEAVKYLTPISAAVLKAEVATPHGLAQFQTAGKYMKDYLTQGEARRREIQKVVVNGVDAAVIGSDFASDFVLVGGRWLKI